MPSIKVIIPVFASLFLSAAAFGADVPPPPAPGVGPGGCHGIMRILTPEERIVHFQEMQKDIGKMTIDQFRDWRKALCDKFAAMTPADRQKYADALDAKWKALPDAEKIDLYHKALDVHGKMGMGRGHGRGFHHDKDMGRRGR